MKVEDLLLPDDEIERIRKEAGGFIAGNYLNSKRASLHTAKVIRDYSKKLEETMYEHNAKIILDAKLDEIIKEMEQK